MSELRMHETQESIYEWAHETFGAADALALVGRANTEMAELVSAVTTGAPAAEVVEEAADVAIVLCRAAHLFKHKSTFSGAVAAVGGDLRKDAIHANRATADLLLEVSRPMGGHPTVCCLLIDRILLMLRRACCRAGTTLDEQVDLKMVVNRQRRWVDTDRGVGATHFTIERNGVLIGTD